MSKKKAKLNSIRLSQKANDAFKILADTKYKQRIFALEKANEFGFALLIYWNRVELALKLRQYYNEIDAFPEKLNFIDKRKTFIKHLYHIDNVCYDSVLEGASSIWKIRNKIAHASFQITIVDYDNYKTQTMQFEKNVRSLIPERNAFLNAKRSSKK